MFKLYQALRLKAFNVLETEEEKSTLGKLIDFILSVLIFANVAVFVLETDASIGQQYHEIFQKFELFSLAIFSIEYVLRVWAVADKSTAKNTLKNHKQTKLAHFKQVWKNRFKWMISPLAIIDLIVILPSLLQQFFAIDLRVLRMLRMLRILKLTRYSASLRMLMKVLKQESGSLKAMLFILVILIMLSASGIYAVEHEVQPDNFGSIPKSMWWSVVTLTTVGYGDVIPITSIGKIFGACITILGIGIAALPAGILASGFANELAEQRKRKEQKFRYAITQDEDTLNNSRKIAKIRKKIGINKEIAVHIVRKMRVEHSILGSNTANLNFHDQLDELDELDNLDDDELYHVNVDNRDAHSLSQNTPTQSKSDTIQSAEQEKNSITIVNSTITISVHCPCCDHQHDVELDIHTAS